MECPSGNVCRTMVIFSDRYVTFRQEIPSGRPDTPEGCSIRCRRSWGLWQPYVTSHALNLFLTVDVVDQSLCGDNLLHELGERLSLEAFACGKILDHSSIEIYLDFIAVLNLPGCLGTLNDGQSDVNGIAVEDSGEGLCDDTADTCSLDGDGGMLSG